MPLVAHIIEAKKMKNQSVGSDFDGFLSDTGMLEEAHLP
jgi:hypothetical protein